ncbi:hypothetical protein BpHYR1_052287 [Brachionus plicatilis]|uniref:Uncharacterized protein n=1 Tax=Brachionus plicatilis TaxID=10195 RepID=A0A3M7S355_BRAPC|nr:hypothetical protein BpHYR1_052287 [Brachionus plicatilis]
MTYSNKVYLNPSLRLWEKNQHFDNNCLNAKVKSLVTENSLILSKYNKNYELFLFKKPARIYTNWISLKAKS